MLKVVLRFLEAVFCDNFSTFAVFFCGFSNFVFDFNHSLLQATGRTRRMFGCMILCKVLEFNQEF